MAVKACKSNTLFTKQAGCKHKSHGNVPSRQLLASFPEGDDVESKLMPLVMLERKLESGPHRKTRMPVLQGRID